MTLLNWSCSAWHQVAINSTICLVSTRNTATSLSLLQCCVRSYAPRSATTKLLAWAEFTTYGTVMGPVALWTLHFRAHLIGLADGTWKLFIVIVWEGQWRREEEADCTINCKSNEYHESESTL